MPRRLDKPASLITAAVFASCLVAGCEEPQSITVEPNRDLSDGTEVTVTLRGYEPNTERHVAQCISGSWWQCGEPVRVSIGADGSARVVLRVREKLRISDFDGSGLERDFDCRSQGACSVITPEFPSLSAPLQFRGEFVPVVTAIPSTNLRVEAPITVTARSLPANIPIWIQQCVAPTGFCQVLDRISTDEKGELTAPVTAHLILDAGAGALPEARTCDTPEECELRLSVADHQFARVPLSFDTRALEWSATPTADLDPVHRVAVRASGVRPHETIRVYQCTEGTEGFPDCFVTGQFDARSPEVPPKDWGNADANGEYSSVVEVRWSGFAGSRRVTCDAPGKCWLALQAGETRLPRRVPLTFNPIGPIAVGNLEVVTAPIAGVPVELVGSAWAANTAVYAMLCASAWECSSGSSANWTSVITDTAGTFAARITPPAFTQDYFGLMMNMVAAYRLNDCSTPGICSFGARDFRSSEATLVPTVVQSAPLARGTADIDGPVPLPDASGVSRIMLTGAGWAPNESLHVYQCTAPGPRPLCTGVGAITTDATGAFSLSQNVMGAFRFMRPYLEATVDCLWPSSACELVVTYSGARVGLADSAHVPLEFAGATSTMFSARVSARQSKWPFPALRRGEPLLHQRAASD